MGFILNHSLKSSLPQKIKEKQRNLGITEEELNMFCLKRSKELYKLGKTIPSKQEIPNLLTKQV